MSRLPVQALMAGALAMLAALPASAMPPSSPSPSLDWRVAQKAAEPAPAKQRLILAGRIYSSLTPDGSIRGPVLVRLKRRLPSEQDFATLPDVLVADAEGRFFFPGLEMGEYQVFFKDEWGNASLVDYAVSDVVRPGPVGKVPVVELDVAWSGLDAEVEGSSVLVTWPTKPGLNEATYQGLVQGQLEGKPKDFTHFPERPSDDTWGRFDMTSDMKRAEALSVVVKYWKAGQGSAVSSYGQSKPIPVKQAK